ncbi:MAG: hypothetical protein VZR55_04725 [Candidatus Enteromonas sp.]|nr:hypothetical protein [Candidatus Enteromonas sp.]
MSEEDNGSEDWIDEAASGKDEISSIDELKGAMPQAANFKAPKE